MHTSRKNPFQISRRSFLRGVSAVGGGALLTGGLRAASGGGLPMRVLGRTGEKVSVLSLGTWPCGKCKELGSKGVERLVDEALDLGINYIDAAEAYGHAEIAIGRTLGKRRDGIFLASKVWADTAAEAEASMEKSLRELRTDYLDLVYIHSMGSRDVGKVLGPDGALEYLLKQKQAGKIRFTGISGHNSVPNFPPLIETDKIDVVLIAMNFVDRHTYGFEDKVLPIARVHGCGVVCMKVFGGMKGGFGVAEGPNTGPEIESRYREQAIRYAMGLEGVNTLVIGPHTVEHLRQNVQWVKNYKPLSARESADLSRIGRRLAQGLGPHFGPVA